MCARSTISVRWLRLIGRERKARKPRGLTSMIWHKRSVGTFPRCSSPLVHCCAIPCRAVNEPKPHGFWLAKNTVAFFRISLSSRRSRFSLRSSAISCSRSVYADGFSGFFRSCCIQWLSVENPTPKSAATCFRVSPLVSATRTASCKSSSPFILLSTIT